MIRFLDLYKQYQSIKSEIDLAISGVIQESSFIGGPGLAQFEENFAAYCQVENCIGVGNGTDALEIAIESLDIPSGSEILVPANSFIASSEAVTRMGHKVIFVDVNPANYVIDTDDLVTKISEKTRAIIAVHLYGHPCDMDVIMQLAEKFKLYVIEDCAQAHGAEYRGRRVGSIGHMAAFSFYPGKNLGAYGDAGAITTGNSSLALKARQIANHGRIAKYDHEFEGRNSRLDGLQAAVLNVKLQYLDSWTERRIDLANYYLEHLAGIDKLVLPMREDWAKQVYHLFVIRVEKRESLVKFLQEKGVQTGVHYPKSLPSLKAYEYLQQLDSSAAYYKHDDQLLSLPIGEHLSIADASYVVSAIREFFKV